MFAKNHDTQLQVSQGRCVYCAESSLSVTVTHNGKVSVASIACKSCRHEVTVALLPDGAKIAKCPKCFSKATLAFGKRDSGGYFVAFSCSLCGWVASEAFMKTASVAFQLLEEGTNRMEQRTNDQVAQFTANLKTVTNLPTCRHLDGVPAAYEAALEAYYLGKPSCPFCGKQYKLTQTATKGARKVIRVTLMSCDCGLFTVDAVRLK